MMKPKDAKIHCGYESDPVHKTCGNCGSFAFDIELPAWLKKKKDDGEAGYDESEITVERYGVEKNLRCTDHGFATKKKATCKLWREKVTK